MKERENKLGHCPYCGSDKIEWGYLYDAKDKIRAAGCMTCGKKSWTNDSGVTLRKLEELPEDLKDKI